MIAMHSLVLKLDSVLSMNGMRDEGMAERAELLESTLSQFPEGIAILGLHGELLFWNRAAEQITGYAGVEIVSRNIPESLESLLHAARAEAHHGNAGPRGVLVHVQHKYGHEVGALARTLVLRDGLGAHIGTGVVFHLSETADALPHGESGDKEHVQASQAELEERLESAYKDFLETGSPLGALWITVDQAHELRRTHGSSACDAMMLKIARTLVNALRQGEEIGRWGDDEFLVLSHTASSEALAEHAQRLAGLARTTDFRWWGDRHSLTVSIGAAQASADETLTDLLQRAQAAMQASQHSGGNHVTLAPGRHACLPS